MPNTCNLYSVFKVNIILVFLLEEGRLRTSYSAHSQNSLKCLLDAVETIKAEMAKALLMVASKLKIFLFDFWNLLARTILHCKHGTGIKFMLSEIKYMCYMLEIRSNKVIAIFVTFKRVRAVLSQE